MIKTRTLREWFRQAFFAMTVRLPIAILILVYLLVCIKKAEFVSPFLYLETLKDYVSSNQTWIYWVAMWPVSLLVLTFYPYTRERNPTYIKKQEAYEKWKAENAAKKNATE